MRIGWTLAKMVDGLDFFMSRIAMSTSVSSAFKRGLENEGAIILPVDFAELEAIEDRIEQREKIRPKEEEGEQKKLVGVKREKSFFFS